MDGAVQPRTRVEQRYAVVEAEVLVLLPQLRGKAARADDRYILLHDAAHAPLDALQLGLRQLVAVVELAVEAAAERMSYMEFASLVPDVAHGLLQDERYGALVDAVALEVGDVDELDRDGRIYLVVKLLEAVVDICRQIGTGGLSAERERYLGERRTHCDLLYGGVVDTDDLDFVSHKI